MHMTVLATYGTELINAADKLVLRKKAKFIQPRHVLSTALIQAGEDSIKVTRRTDPQSLAQERTRECTFDMERNRQIRPFLKKLKMERGTREVRGGNLKANSNLDT